MDLAEEFVCYLVSYVLEKNADDISFSTAHDKGLLERLQGIISAPFERISYTDAIKILEEKNSSFEFPVGGLISSLSMRNSSRGCIQEAGYSF